MKRLLFWSTVIAVFVTYAGGGTMSAIDRWLQAWSDKAMGGACAAFMEGGALEAEYLIICTDEVVNVRTAGNLKFRYDVAQRILLDALPEDGRKDWRQPSARQLRVALMAQWGGACDFVLGPSKPLPEAQDVRADTRMRGCLMELKHRRKSAWKALLARHFRLADEEYWVGEYLPTHDQLRRALDAEGRTFGVRTINFFWMGAALGGVSVLVQARGELFTLLVALGDRMRRRPEKPKTERRPPPDDEPRARARSQSYDSVYWMRADPDFKTWFDKHFHPERGLYGRPAMRQRVYECFLDVVDAMHLQSKKGLVRQLRAMCHPDRSVDGVFSASELTSLSQHINQHLPVWKEA